MEGYTNFMFDIYRDSIYFIVRTELHILKSSPGESANLRAFFIT